MSEKLNEAFEGFVGSVEWVMTEQRQRFEEFLKGAPEEVLADLALWTSEIAAMANYVVDDKRIVAQVAAGMEVEEGTESADELRYGEWVEVAGSPVDYLDNLAMELVSVLRNSTGKAGSKKVSKDSIRMSLLNGFDRIFGNGIDSKSLDAKKFWLSLREHQKQLDAFDLALFPFEIAIHLDPINAQADGNPGVYSLPFALKASIHLAGSNGMDLDGIRLEPNEEYFQVSIKSLPSEGRYSRAGSRYDDLSRVDKGSLMRRAVELGVYRK